MAHGMPNTRTIDFDDGLQSVEWAILAGKIKKELSEIIYKTILPDGRDKSSILLMLDEASDQIDEWLADGTEWDTLIIDSASGLNEASIVKGLDENRRLGQSKSWADWRTSGWTVRPMRIQDWGSAGYLQLKFIEWCRSLNKNIVIIAHEYNNTDERGVTVSYEPLLIGQNRQLVPKSFDEVWYAHMAGTRQQPVGKIQTTSGGKRHCGSRIGCLDPIEVLDFYAFRDKVAKFYKIPAEDLWTAKATKEDAMS